MGGQEPGGVLAEAGSRSPGGEAPVAGHLLLWVFRGSTELASSALSQAHGQQIPADS